MPDGIDENFTIRLLAPSVNAEMRSSFVGYHISATFELRAGSGVPDARIPARWGGGVVKAEARRVERSESLDDVEHSSTLIM